MDAAESINHINFLLVCGDEFSAFIITVLIHSISCVSICSSILAIIMMSSGLCSASHAVVTGSLGLLVTLLRGLLEL